MGSGSWSSKRFADYTVSTKKCSLDGFGSVAYDTSTTAQDIYTTHSLDPDLDPRVIRECIDTEEHPNTIPVIISLDVSGSMGQSAVEVSKKLNVIMTDLYKDHKDIEFMVMAIDDLAYDDVPIQVSQFESDIRIAEQLDKIYFEGGGGCNLYESYTAAWYFGLNNTLLDCYDKRGKKGIIITLGDERINPYLPAKKLSKALGTQIPKDIETKELYIDASKKFDIYHIHVNHGEYSRNICGTNVNSFAEVIGENNVAYCEVQGIAQKIVEFINTSIASQGSEDNTQTSQNQDNGIVWDNTPIDTPEENVIQDAIMSNDITW